MVHLYNPAMRLITFCQSIVIDYQKDAERERTLDKEREERFSGKYPLLTSIPILSTVSRWLYTQTWLFTGLLLVIILLGFGLRLKGLGTMDFLEDEFQVIEAAYGYLQSGTFYRWEWLANGISNNYYDRAWPHTLMITESFRWFGLSEWSARLPSLIFGTLLIPLAYFLGKHATDRKVIALMLAAIVAFSPKMIFLSQYARMYVVFIPVFLIGSYLLFSGLEKKSPWRSNNVPLARWIMRYFDFDYRYLITAAIVLYFSFLIHISTLLIGVGMFGYVFIMAFTTREERYLCLTGCISIILSVIIAGYGAGIQPFPSFFSWIDIYAPNKSEYFFFLFDYPFGIFLSLFLLAVLGVLIKKNRELLYYLCLTVTALAFFAFFSDRHSHFLYISNFMVIAWLLLLPGAAFIAYSFFRTRENIWQIVFSAFVLLAVFTPLMGTPGILIEKYRVEDSMYCTFREGYADLNAGYRDGDLLMAQYLRTYYITISGDIRIESLQNYQSYSYDRFLDTTARHDRIWITWETRKSYHIQPEIIEFVDAHFEKIHGEGIDETNVELYLWDKTRNHP